MIKKIFPFILAIFLLVGCEKNEIISDRIIDYRHNESYTETVTNYHNRYNAMSDTWQYLPDIHTEYHPESFELLHEYTYSNGYTKRVWQECTQWEYKITQEKLDASGSY